MTTIASITRKIRSKNAGPFWLTIDVFCDTSNAFQTIAQALSSERTAAALQVDPKTIKRFEIAGLNVVKISVPRPTIQGTRQDRDMHGASFANILAELEIET